MTRTLSAVLVLGLAAAVAAQPPKDAPKAPPKLKAGPAFEQAPYGKTPAKTDDKTGKVIPGELVTQYTLINRNGVTLNCIDYGAIITELNVPDKNGRLADVVLGCGSLADYMAGHPYFGSNAGRSANRIAKGKFTLDGREYTLATNNGPNHLHGGKEGFDKKVWRSEPFLGATGPGVRFTYLSKDMEEGYPGNLSVVVSYTLNDDNEVVIDYRATTDKPTICNLAHHSYFNLAGHATGDVRGHVVQILANNYTPADDTLIPTGKIAPVAGTPFDFTTPKPIGKDLAAAGGETPAIGFDLNYVLDKGTTPRPELAARVTEPKSGRVLEVLTTEPGLQFYTGNFLDKQTGKGTTYNRYGGFCMEPQKFPDSVNKPEWKDRSNVILRPGETYKQTTVYRFTVAK